MLEKIEKIIKEIKSMKEKNDKMGFYDLLILFIAFKLLGIIDWSWWWVLSPLWLPTCIILAIFIVVIIITLVVMFVKGE